MTTARCPGVKLWVVAGLALEGGLLSCADSPDRILVLDYRDFGPQAAAWEVLGMEWWQWEASGYPQPGRRYEIRVVVYRNLSPEEVVRRYPVVPEEERDYRYVTYGDAMDYLDARIREDPDLRPRLSRTRARILSTLGSRRPARADPPEDETFCGCWFSIVGGCAGVAAVSTSPPERPALLFASSR